MDTNFIIVLDPIIDEETGELILVVSKINAGDDAKDMEILGTFTGDKANEIVNLLLADPKVNIPVVFDDITVEEK